MKFRRSICQRGWYGITIDSRWPWQDRGPMDKMSSNETFLQGANQQSQKKT
jgi:hypothetical protein